MGLKERLLSFIEYKKFSVQRFEHEVGLSNASGKYNKNPRSIKNRGMSLVATSKLLHKYYITFSSIYTPATLQ